MPGTRPGTHSGACESCVLDQGKCTLGLYWGLCRPVLAASLSCTRRHGGGHCEPDCRFQLSLSSLGSYHHVPAPFLCGFSESCFLSRSLCRAASQCRLHFPESSLPLHSTVKLLPRLELLSPGFLLDKYPLVVPKSRSKGSVL